MSALVRVMTARAAPMARPIALLPPAALPLLSPRLPLLPAEARVMAVSFVASMGQIGAAGFPAVLGLIAERTGIRVFQVVIFAQMAVVLVLWIVFTRQRRA